MKKRIAALILVLALLLSVSPVYAASTFPDVSNTSVYFKYINSARRLKIIDGYPDGTFRPNNPVTYGQFIKMCVKGEKADDRGNSNWAAGYYFCARENGYFGANDVSVNVLDNPIPRAYMALILGNMLEALGLSDPDVGYTEFSDVPRDYKYEYQIAQCYESGIIQGYSKEVFGVDDTLTRAQAATVLVRMEDLKDKKEEEKTAEIKKENKEGYTYYEGYGWVKDEYASYKSFAGTYKVDNDPRSAEERMPKTQKAIIDEINDTLKFTGSNGNYSFTYHQPEVPDKYWARVQISIFDTLNSEGAAKTLYSFIANPFIDIDSSDHTVKEKITGVSSIKGKKVIILIDVVEKWAGESSAYQYIVDYDGSIKLTTSYTTNDEDKESSSSEFDRFDISTINGNEMFQWK